METCKSLAVKFYTVKPMYKQTQAFILYITIVVVLCKEVKTVICKEVWKSQKGMLAAETG